MCRTEQLQVSFAGQSLLQTFISSKRPQHRLSAGRTHSKKQRQKEFCMPSFLSKTPFTGEMAGRNKGETGIPWLMEVKALWKKKPSPFPILLPSQSSIDYHFSPFLPLWHTQQVRFTHNTH